MLDLFIHRGAPRLAPAFDGLVVEPLGDDALPRLVGRRTARVHRLAGELGRRPLDGRGRLVCPLLAHHRLRPPPHLFPFLGRGLAQQLLSLLPQPVGLLALPFGVALALTEAFQGALQPIPAAPRSGVVALRLPLRAPFARFGLLPFASGLGRWLLPFLRLSALSLLLRPLLARHGLRLHARLSRLVALRSLSIPAGLWPRLIAGFACGLLTGLLTRRVLGRPLTLLAPRLFAGPRRGLRLDTRLIAGLRLLARLLPRFGLRPVGWSRTLLAGPLPVIAGLALGRATRALAFTGLALGLFLYLPRGVPDRLPQVLDLLLGVALGLALLVLARDPLGEPAGGLRVDPAPLQFAPRVLGRHGALEFALLFGIDPPLFKFPVGPLVEGLLRIGRSGFLARRGWFARRGLGRLGCGLFADGLFALRLVHGSGRLVGSFAGRLIGRGRKGPGFARRRLAARRFTCCCQPLGQTLQVARELITLLGRPGLDLFEQFLGRIARRVRVAGLQRVLEGVGRRAPLLAGLTPAFIRRRGCEPPGQGFVFQLSLLALGPQALREFVQLRRGLDHRGIGIGRALLKLRPEFLDDLELLGRRDVAGLGFERLAGRLARLLDQRRGAPAGLGGDCRGTRIGPGDRRDEEGGNDARRRGGRPRPPRPVEADGDRIAEAHARRGGVAVAHRPLRERGIFGLVRLSQGERRGEPILEPECPVHLARGVDESGAPQDGPGDPGGKGASDGDPDQPWPRHKAARQPVRADEPDRQAGADQRRTPGSPRQIAPQRPARRLPGHPDCLVRPVHASVLQPGKRIRTRSPRTFRPYSTFVIAIQDVLRSLLTGRTLSSEETEEVFEGLLAGRFDDAQIGSLLSLIQARGATADELLGAARVMRRHVTPVPADGLPGLIDTCGTGGAAKTFNISTAVAVVAAAAVPGHVHVAKHGGRSRTGRGSADVLQALGVRVDPTPEVQARCLREVGVCFCFAVHHHPAMKHAAPARKSLGFPTIFNLLGPLTNPAGARRQLMGIYDPTLAPLIAETLVKLGAERAMVVHGSDGIDELTTSGPSTIASVKHGGVTISEFDPASLGVPRGAPDQFTVPGVAESAAMIRLVLSGERGPARDIVILNAAAALVVAGAVDELADGIALAGAAIDSGRAAQTLAALARLSNA